MSKWKAFVDMKKDRTSNTIVQLRDIGKQKALKTKQKEIDLTDMQKEKVKAIENLVIGN